MKKSLIVLSACLAFSLSAFPQKQKKQGNTLASWSEKNCRCQTECLRTDEKEQPSGFFKGYQGETSCREVYRRCDRTG